MFETNNSPFTMPVIPAAGNGYGNNGAFGDGGWLWFIVVIFAIFGGWGGNGWNNGNPALTKADLCQDMNFS